MSIAWTLLPWSFGLQNYVKAHNQCFSLAARCYWLVLLLVHPLLMYAIWFYDVTYWYLLLLVAAHILFLYWFGRDLGTS